MGDIGLMKACIIDSTANELVLVAINGDVVNYHVGVAGARRHTGEILVALDNLLSKTDMEASELEYVGVVVGPGSFTGIRIGVSTANAMAYASGAKLVELTELECLLINHESALGLIDCKHDNYYALYKEGENMEYKAVNVVETQPYEGERVYFTSPDPDNLYKCFIKKLTSGQFSDIAKPYYMKKSSAEA